MAQFGRPTDDITVSGFEDTTGGDSGGDLYDELGGSTPDENTYIRGDGVDTCDVGLTNTLVDPGIEGHYLRVGEKAVFNK